MIYPIRYYYRGKVSDKDFILARMAQCRKNANTYLHNEARKYQAERNPDAYQRHLDKMKGMVKQDKPQPKKQTSSGVVNQSALPSGMKGIQLDW